VKASLAAVLCAAIAASSAARAQEAAVKAGEAFIKKWDSNGDCWVSFQEFKDAETFKKMDKNGDGRITVGDFLMKSAGPGDSMMMMSPENRQLYRYQGFQTIAIYDRNKDGVLDEDELKFLLIVVMDADEDKVLSAMEIKASKSPPGMSLEPGWFQKDAKAFDTNGDGVIVPSEMRVPEVVIKGLDKNKDGKISLEELARAQVALIGGSMPQFFEMSDLIGQKTKVDRANWLGDPELFRRLDEDKDGFVTAIEFDRYARNLKQALSLCNDFVTRHDLDGDQKVSRREFPGGDSMFHRMDKNHDGVVTSADR
jgi:Ca2+-binding EF-hand superfamily protein